jgi:phosphatidylserine/phosphatidylglycerophosphate/cardiolipin synthase-like enzyme
MRSPPTKSGALTVRAISGTHAVLLGFDLAVAPAKDFLGFALERTDRTARQTQWLPNFLRFERNDRPGGPFGTDKNPVQAFQWGDYTVTPGQRLRYRVQSMYGKPDAPQARDEVSIEIDTEPADDGKHGVFFNRGVAGSQAYVRKFGNNSPVDMPEAQRWMSRGLEEGLLTLVERAEGKGWGLHGAFYEFFHGPVLGALHKAALRGVDVRLAVASPSAANWPDYPSWQNIEAIRQFHGTKKPPPPTKGLSSFLRPRRHSGDIPHNKFVVLLEPGKGPVAVWTGSTNITPGALWGHSNVGHLVTDAKVAKAFLDYADQLFDNDPDHKTLTPLTEQATPLASIADGATTPLFSPRADESVLQHYADSIKAAKQSVFITAPFGLAPQIRAAFAVDRDIPRYLLLETAGQEAKLGRGDPDLQIAAGAYLGEPGGWHQFLQEHLTGLNDHVKYIHTKYLLIDPLTDDPTVITGSANFSPNSTTDNDENMLVIRGNTRVADIYLSEFMRLFTHLKFRFDLVGKSKAARAPNPAEPDVSASKHLHEDNAWTKDYFKAASPKARERQLFSGAS